VNRCFPSSPALFFAGFFFCAATIASGAPPDPQGAIAAMKAMPFKFKNGILEVSGKGGNPQPQEWTIIARDVDNMGTITLLTVAGGQVINQRPSANPGQMFRESGFLMVPEITIDNGVIFQTAQKFVQENSGSALASVDYTLTRPASDLAPVWKLVCRDARGKVIGRLTLSALNGSIMTQSGFPQR